MLGFVFGAIICSKRAVARGLDAEQISNALTWGGIGAIIGTRGFYVLAHLDQYDSILDAVNVLQGGLTLFGGFVGGLIGAIAYLIRRKIPLWLALDSAAPGFVIGVFIGRIGDLVIADHLGRTTDFFLGYKIPQGADLAPGYGPPFYVPGAVVHQTALYDMIGVTLLAVALAYVARRAVRPGVLFATFALWYGAQRIAIDFTRNQDLIEANFFGLGGSQWAGVLFVTMGLAMLIFLPRLSASVEPIGPVADQEASFEVETNADVDEDPRVETDIGVVANTIFGPAWSPATSAPPPQMAPLKLESES